MTETAREAGGADALAEELKGSLIGPGDAGYDEARALYNAMIDKRPALIVRAAPRRADGDALAFRDANWAMVMAGVDSDPENADAISNWSKSYWEALHPYSAAGAYVNMMMEEGDDRVRASYGENYERLARIKAEYDGDNLFHVNQNIRPRS